MGKMIPLTSSITIGTLYRHIEDFESYQVCIRIVTLTANKWQSHVLTFQTFITVVVQYSTITMFLIPVKSELLDFYYVKSELTYVHNYQYQRYIFQYILGTNPEREHSVPSMEKRIW